MFIYCLTPELRDTLLSKGLKLIQTKQTSEDQSVWVFELNKNIKLQENKKTEFFYSNKLTF